MARLDFGNHSPGALQGAEQHTLRAIQHAHYVEGRRVVEVSVLTAVAGSIGLAENEFTRALETAAVDDHIAATGRLMQHAGLRPPCRLPERDQSPRSDLDMTKTTMVASEATRQPGLARAVLTLGGFAIGTTELATMRRA